MPRLTVDSFVDAGIGGSLVYTSTVCVCANTNGAWRCLCMDIDPEELVRYLVESIVRAALLESRRGNGEAVVEALATLRTLRRLIAEGEEMLKESDGGKEVSGGE